MVCDAAGDRKPCEAPQDVPAASRVQFPGRAPAEAASSATPSFGRKRPRPVVASRAGYMQAMAGSRAYPVSGWAGSIPAACANVTRTPIGYSRSKRRMGFRRSMNEAPQAARRRLRVLTEHTRGSVQTVWQPGKTGNSVGVAQLDRAPEIPRPVHRQAPGCTPKKRRTAVTRRRGFDSCRPRQQEVTRALSPGGNGARAVSP